MMSVKKVIPYYGRYHWWRNASQVALKQKPCLKYKVGENIFGYCVKEIEPISELNLTAVLLEHQATGASHLHIDRNDSNNVFSVALKTTPENSCGVPHILEHLALCGSKRFPVRDPFFNMLNRSLSTFMNAFTDNDNTMYPFSTQNPKDFKNLLSVYLDSVFFPSLLEMDFRQEGWRLEHENPNDKDSPIIFKGVVFNEMKGVYSDPNQYYAENLQNKLYPSSTYSHNSGGDPLIIPELSYEELKAFHATHYHPSNSRFFTYGNFPLESHLEQIEKEVLSKFTKIEINNRIPDEEPWSKPREVQIYNRFDPMASIPEKQTTLSVSYMLNSVTDTYESFALSILGSLLVDGPNAPFYQSLIESGLGPDFSPCTGYSGQQKQSAFSIGLREIAEKDTERVKEIIQTTFDRVLRSGFPEGRIQAILHNVELSTKHQSSNFGLHCAMGVNKLWNHHGNPITGLKVNNHVSWFVKQMKENPNFLQDKVQHYFKENSHKLTLIMSPKEKFEEENKAREEQLLHSKVIALKENDKTNIYNQGLALLKYQQEAGDYSCLPSLQLQDVQRELDKTPIQDVMLSGVPMQICEQPTNEVVYFNALIQTKKIPDDLLIYLPLFSNVITKMGAGHRDYKAFDQEAELKTGGLFSSIHVSEAPDTHQYFKKEIQFSSYCLSENVDAMFNLWEDVFNRVRLEDCDRLSQLIRMTAAEMAQGIVSRGHLYSMQRASSCLTSCANIREKMSGLTQVSFMKKLAELNNYEEVIEKLRFLHKMLLKKDSFRCSINASADLLPSVTSRMETFLNAISGTALSDASNELNCLGSESEKIHFVLPYSVNYIGKSILTVPYTHPDFAKLRVAAGLMSSKFLHREIREKGGAYGGGASVTKGGAFMFYSYRDPCFTQTLNSFQSGVEWLASGDYSDQYIKEAKLKVFSEVDKPIPPGSKGSARFMYEITDEMKQKLREGIFHCHKEDIIHVTQKYLEGSKQAGTTLIGPENDITKSEGWLLHRE